MENAASKIISRVSSLRAERASLERVWKDCYEHTFPIRASGLLGDAFTADQAKNKVADLLTTEGTRGARDIASIIVGGMTPSNAKWFDLVIDDVEKIEDEALKKASDIIFRKIHSSNYDSEAVESMLDNVIAGQSATYISENEDASGYSFEQWNLADVFASSTRRDGVIDTIYHCYSMTAEQAVKEFGDALSDKIKSDAAKKPSQLYQFIHYIAPRTDYIPGSPFQKDLPFLSYHIEEDSKEILRESGYHEFPVCFPRWQKQKESAYGVGLVYDALPAIKELNELKRLEKLGLGIAAAGMYIAQDDGILNPSMITIGAGEIVVAASTDSLKPLGSSNNFSVTFSQEERLQAEIRATLMADQLPPVESGVRTATEFHVRLQYLRQLLGPVFGRLNSEWLQVLVLRCFGIAFRNGWIELPESLSNRVYNVKYLSPLAQAQRESEIASVERFMGQVTGIMQVNPQIIDNIDTDEVIRQLADKQNIVDIIRSKDEVEELRAQREKAQEAQRQQMMQEQISMTAATEQAKAAAAYGQV
ncbi:portal protein [Orbaceae bacterium ESL0721]|nr:portal protein [Orbaceae bacterium ESL0721]